jgi:hypothetical protein
MLNFSVIIHPDFYKVKNPVFSFVRSPAASNQFLIAWLPIADVAADEEAAAAALASGANVQAASERSFAWL